MKVVYVYADTPQEWNCSQWRCLTPADAINYVGEDFTAKLIHVSGFVEYLNPVVQEIVGNADVIVFQRNMVSEDAFDAMAYWQGLGKPVVVDLDDAYHILPYSNPAHKFWLENEDGLALSYLEEGLRRSNGLVAPNRLLLSDWAHVARGYYMPNYAEGKWWRNLPTREEQKAARGLTDKIVIGWGGSVSHYDGFWGSGIRQAAERITRRFPQVVWMICGNDPRIFNQFPVSRANKFLQPGVDPNDWPKVVKTFDIGIAPLYGPYDQRRSWIKGLEYLLAGVPWVGTAGEPYRDLAHMGKLIPNGVDQWEIALAELVTNIKDAQEYATTLQPTAEQWLAENQVAGLRDFYQRIINDFSNSHVSLPGVYRVA